MIGTLTPSIVPLHAVVPCRLERQSRNRRQNIYAMWRKAELGNHVRLREIRLLHVQIRERRSKPRQRLENALRIWGAGLNPNIEVHGRARHAVRAESVRAHHHESRPGLHKLDQNVAEIGNHPGAVSVSPGHAARPAS